MSRDPKAISDELSAAQRVVTRLAIELADANRERRVCSIDGCGEGEPDFLTDVTVTVAADEEGFAEVTQLLCDEHIVGVCAHLIELGFVSHRHGGINYLESETCGGYGICKQQYTGREPETIRPSPDSGGVTP